MGGDLWGALRRWARHAPRPSQPDALLRGPQQACCIDVVTCDACAKMGTRPDAARTAVRRKGCSEQAMHTSVDIGNCERRPARQFNLSRVPATGDQLRRQPFESIELRTVGIVLTFAS
jgi:hypothetical protein